MRRYYGVINCSAYGKLGKVLEANHAEIIACLQALQRATELRIQKAIMEKSHVGSDSQCPSYYRSSTSSLLWELKSLMCNFQVLL
jgi:hypothetical protein